MSGRFFEESCGGCGKTTARGDGRWIGNKRCAKEELALVNHRDLHSEGLLMRPAYYAGKSGDWKSCLEQFRIDDKLSVWASVKVRECYNEVDAEDESRLSIAQDILRTSTYVLRRILAPNDGSSHQSTKWKESLCRTCALIVIASRLRTTLGGSLLGMERNRVAGGWANMIVGLRTGTWYTPRITERRQFSGSCGTTRNLRHNSPVGKVVADLLGEVAVE